MSTPLDTEALTPSSELVPAEAVGLPGLINRYRESIPELVTEPLPPVAQLVAQIRVQAGGSTFRIFWAYTVTVPATVFAHWVRWVTQEPARTLGWFIGSVIVASGLNRIPVLSWFVPDFLDVFSWWAWLFG